MFTSSDKLSDPRACDNLSEETLAELKEWHDFGCTAPVDSTFAVTCIKNTEKVHFRLHHAKVNAGYFTTKSNYNIIYEESI